MPDYTFPFPNQELALQELSYDPCCSKIEEEDKADCRTSMAKGCRRRPCGLGEIWRRDGFFPDRGKSRAELPPCQ